MAVLSFSEVIPAPRPHVFECLTDVRRLPELLAPDIDARIVHAPEELKRGAEASLELTRFGFAQATRWRIEDVLRGSRLTFRQVEGIFKTWTHTLRFTDEDGGTRVSERIEYRVPGGLLGYLADDFVINKDMERILRLRLTRAAELLKPDRVS